MRSLVCTSILTFFLFGHEAVSQEYSPIFVSEKMKWNTLIAYCDLAITDSLMYIGDETLIKEKKYKVLRAYPDNREIYIREDVNSEKLWYFSIPKDKELLIMDLSLEPDDVFYIHHFLNDSTAFRVESVYYENNRKHLKLNTNISLCGTGDYLIFIEGIGPNAGFQYQKGYLNINSVNTYLLCAFDDGQMIYQNLAFSETEPDPCWISGTSSVKTEQTINEEVYLFPNPSANFINIKHNKPASNIFFSIMNQTGQIVQNGELLNADHKIDLSSLPGSLYFYIIIIYGETYTGKILKLD